MFQSAVSSSIFPRSSSRLVSSKTTKGKMDLPTLDFSRFLYGSEEERFELAVALVDSLKSHGFVKLVNHGIREETVRDNLSAV